jgi:phosphoglycolate phosphatase-like HAD superfamily hydrolase
MKTLDIRPEKTVMVGDTPVDVATARNAGVYSIVVTSGVTLQTTTLDAIQQSKPDIIVSSLSGLLNILYDK